METDQISKRFDAAPDYGIRTLQHPAYRNDVIFYDGLGATAADSIGTILDLLGNRELTRIWKELVSDEQ